MQSRNKYKHILIFLLIIFGIYISKFLLTLEINYYNNQNISDFPIKLLTVLTTSLFFIQFLPFLKKIKYIFISILIGILLFLINNLEQNIYYKPIITKLNNHKVIIRGEITELNDIGFNTKKIKIKSFSISPQLATYSNKNDKIILSSNFSFISRNNNQKISLFDTIEVIGQFKTFKEPKNLYEKDFNNYAFNKYIAGEIKNPRIIEHNKLETFSAMRFVNDFKLGIENIFDKYLSIKSSGFIKAIILGEKSDLEAEIKNNFKKSGVLHLLAVSGLHVGFLFIFISLLLKNILGIGRKPFFVITSLIIIFYIFLTGLSPSVIRAGLMVIILLLSEPLKRKLKIYDILATSGILSILIDSNQAFGVGFKLTFLAVFSIIFIFNEVNNFYLNKINTLSERNNNFVIKHLLHKDSFSYKFIIVTILLSISISIGTLPLVMYEFGRLNLFSIMLNILLIPLTGIAFTLASLVLIFSYASTVITFFIAAGLEIINDLIFNLINMTELADMLSYNHKFDIIEALITALLILFIVFYKHKKIRIISLASMSLCLTIFIYNYDNSISKNSNIYSFILSDEKNVSSKIIISPLGENILLLNADVKKNDLRNIIIPYLYNKHISEIDFLVFLDKSNKFQKKIDILSFFDFHNRSEFNINIKNVLIYNEDKNRKGEFAIFNREYLPKMYKNTNFIEIENIKNSLKLLNARIYFYNIDTDKNNLDYEIYFDKSKKTL